MNRTESTHILDEISRGDADFYIGAKNAVIADYTDRRSFNHIGATSGGFSVSFTDEKLRIECGTPQELVKMLLIKTGIEITMKFQEALVIDQWYKALGHGKTDEVVADASVAVSTPGNSIIIFGPGYNKVPYQNITVTKISDNEATPNVYEDADITTNFAIDLDEGRFRLKTSTEGGTISPVTYGKQFYWEGTWSKPIEKTLTVVGEADEESDYYGIWLIAPKNGLRTKSIYIPKAYSTDIETVNLSPTESRIVGCKFVSAKAPEMLYQFMLIDEVPS